MPIGIVKYFLPQKAHGYILVEESREEFHVRAKHLIDEIATGDRVTFEIKEDKNGLYATQVKLLKSD